MKEDIWLREFLRFFRPMGFYEEFADLTDEELGKKLLDSYRTEFGEIDPDDEYADLYLLKEDTNRVWWEDTEADVCDGNEVYVETLRRWHEISRGTFNPKGIKENWKTETGPIKVSFSLVGQQLCLNPKYRDDWLDLDLLLPINLRIRPTGKQFEVYEEFDQTAFVVVLTRDERSLLEQERNWRFANSKPWWKLW